jgi:hypothetical protein
LGVLRAVQVSAPGRPALGQWPIGPVNSGETDPDKIKFTGEITNLWPFVMWLREQYGELTENFTVDAGLWSRELFARFDAAGFGLFGNLKENKPELFAEAERVLRIAMARREPHAQTDWETTSKGKIKRELWRTTELDGWNGWRHWLGPSPSQLDDRVQPHAMASQMPCVRASCENRDDAAAVARTARTHPVRLDPRRHEAACAALADAERMTNFRAATNRPSACFPRRDDNLP